MPRPSLKKEEEDKEEAELRRDLLNEVSEIKPKRSFKNWCKTFLFGVIVGLLVGVIVWYFYVYRQPSINEKVFSSSPRYGVGLLLKQVEELGREREKCFVWSKRSEDD